MVDVTTVIDEPQKPWDETSCLLSHSAISFFISVFEGVHITLAGELGPSEQTTSSCNVMAWDATCHAKGAVPLHSFIIKPEAPEWFPLMQGFLSSKPHSLNYCYESHHIHPPRVIPIPFLHGRVDFSLSFFELIHITVGIQPSCALTFQTSHLCLP